MPVVSLGSPYVPAGHALYWAEEFDDLSLDGVTSSPRWYPDFRTWGGAHGLDGNSDGAWKENEEAARDAGMSIHDALHARAVAGDYATKTRYLHDVSSGTLKLRCYRTPTAILGDVDTAFYGYPIVAGMIEGSNRPALEFGYWETRVRLNAISEGLHFAVWLIANDGDWPPEIDLMEAVSGTIPGADTMAGKWAIVLHEEAGAPSPTGQQYIEMGASYNDWVTIGCRVDQSDIKVYYDGVLKYSTANSITDGKELIFVASWEGDSNWPGPIVPGTVFPGEFEIDYIRCYYQDGYTPPVPDGVPDGAAALPGPKWLLEGVTRSVGVEDVNPPIVTLTEELTTEAHWAVYDGSDGITGNRKIEVYLRAGTRRYVGAQIANNTIVVWATVDTQMWTITQTGAAGGASLTSSGLTDLGDGDYKLTLVGDMTAASGGDFSAVYGRTSGAGGPGQSYLGDGSTIIVRRFDRSAL